MRLAGRSLIQGAAQAALLHADVGLSFWGGVDPATGEVIDRHHPLSGECIAGKILALPSGRGSCTGSGVMLELILNGHAPAGLLLAEPDEILTLGVLVAETMFGRSFPVVCIGHEGFEQIKGFSAARLENGSVWLHQGSADALRVEPADATPSAPADNRIRLEADDIAMLDGRHGKAAQVAMQMLMRIGALQDATELVSVTQAHIDGCIYTGPASLQFAQQLVAWGAKVRVPTTLNSISVDQRKWRELGVPAELGEPASALGDAYMAMGASMSFTCAPYLLNSAPKLGDQIVWAESNAVVYANSVLGARTLKYPDYLDICIAITGRAPNVGSHRDGGRLAVVRVDVEKPAGADDAFYPLLGYQLGLLAASDIPVICGLEQAAPTLDDLKAFGAAFATTSAAPMFHIAGVTPEAPDADTALGGRPARRHAAVSRDDLARAWRELDSAPEAAVQLVSLGNPHFSLSECARLAALCRDRTKHADVALIITMGRDINKQARAAGHLDVLEAFGAQIITDTCWCMLGEPVVPAGSSTLMTNSGKYAHYAPGLVNRKVHFGSLANCVEAACSGSWEGRLPAWLR